VDLRVSPVSERSPEDAEVSVHADFAGTAALVEHVMSIVLEATRNVRRHAQARSAAVSVQARSREIVVTVDDDGIGFPPAAPLPWSIVSRVAECGGTLRVRADAGRGAHLVVALPSV
jgi:signal transduction histidine kinase